MRSYYFKNFITVAALVLLSFLILSASFVLVGRNYALRERRETIESNAIELHDYSGFLKNQSGSLRHLRPCLPRRRIHDRSLPQRD